jgi:hypothetical protein
MRYRFSEGVLTKAVISALLLAVSVKASPVSKDEALRAATSELPGFFNGPWQQAGEFPLHNLEEETVAYTFIFARAQSVKGGAAESLIPSEYITKKRQSLTDAGKSVSGNESVLYGSEHFASIVISADDTEPVVLRCFLGLPAQEVKRADACALAARKNGAAAWRVSQSLMLGLFDEAFCVEKEDGSERLVVDMRSGAVVTYAAAKAVALKKKRAVADDELIRLCKIAWSKYRVAGKTPVVPVAGRREKKSGTLGDADPLLKNAIDSKKAVPAVGFEEKKR